MRARRLNEKLGCENKRRRRKPICRNGPYHDDLLPALLIPKD